MEFWDQLKQYNKRHLQERQPLLGELREKTDRFLAALEETERLYLQFLLATLPLSDIADNKPRFFLSFVREALLLREQYPWCSCLNEADFLLYVLHPRAGDEELSDCRPAFRAALEPRIRGLSFEQAVLEVNRWCAENVSYRSTDERTSSALEVYRRGFGRCGEESAFAVNALRSVGIAARQVYVPWWSHCDDNHAWVEVFDGKRWRCLGACEPEPELDRGWFTAAASRAMLVRARSILPGGEEELSFLFSDREIWADRGMVCENATPRYARTRPLTIAVKMPDGSPASGVNVTLSLLNMANFQEIAVLKTGQDGTISITLGLGNVLLSVFSDQFSCETLVDTAQTDRAELLLMQADEKNQWVEFAFRAPVGSSEPPRPLAKEAAALRRRWLEQAAALREDKLAALGEPSDMIDAQYEETILTLSEKDRSGIVDPAILRDSLSANAFAGESPEEIYRRYLLSPRIGLEPLSAWRGAVISLISPADQAKMREDPRLIRSWIDSRFADAQASPALPGSILGSLRLGALDPAGKALLFCAVCRALGVPARLSPLTGCPEYFVNEMFHPLAAFGEPSALLTLHAPAAQAALAGQNFSLSRRTETGWQELHPESIPAGESRDLPLSAGLYRVICATRLPSGDQKAAALLLELAAGDSPELPLRFPQAQPAELLTARLLPDFTLKTPEGVTVESKVLLAERRRSLLFWLEPGREPTEHILLELRESAGNLARTDCAVYLILEDTAGVEKALAPLLTLLPGARLWQGDFPPETPARQLFAEPDSLPLILLADEQNRSLFCRAGYHVGTAELLLRLLEIS